MSQTTRKPRKKTPKTPVEPIKGNAGVRLVPLHFGTIQGRVMYSIVNKDGEVFQPSVYDIPYDPFRCLAFAAALIQTMMRASYIVRDSDTRNPNNPKYKMEDCIVLEDRSYFIVLDSMQNILNELGFLSGPDGSKVGKQPPGYVTSTEKKKIKEQNK